MYLLPMTKPIIWLQAIEMLHEQDTVMHHCKRQFFDQQRGPAGSAGQKSWQVSKISIAKANILASIMEYNWQIAVVI